MAKPREHRVSIAINGREIGGWTEYEIETSIVEPVGRFSLTRPRDIDAWRLCHRDATVKVLIDGLPRMFGFVEERRTSSRAGTMTITGLDRAGRLVAESAPRSAYGGKTMLDVVKALAEPWYTKVTLDNARNRKVQLGKGAKVAGLKDPIALLKGKRSTKASDPIKALFAKPSKSANRVDPGQSRWEVIEQIASRAGLAAWTSADGKELFLGRPDHEQPATFYFRHGRGQSNVIDIDYGESNADRYSMITAVGSGITSAADYGEAASSRAGVVYDNPDNPVDGTGRDFLFAKRLVLPEQGVADRGEASRIAGREQLRRDFKRTGATITTWYHGQLVTGSARTLFANDTIARVIDDDIELDVDMMIHTLRFKASRDQGETTELEVVPRHTEIVL